MQVYTDSNVEITLDIDADELVGEAESTVQEIIDEHTKPLVQRTADMCVRIMHLEKLAGMVHNEDGYPIDPEVEAEAEAAREMEEMADAQQAEADACLVLAWATKEDGPTPIMWAHWYIKLGWTEERFTKAWYSASPGGVSLAQVLDTAGQLESLGLVTREVQA